jgi:hypothetical protein
MILLLLTLPWLMISLTVVLELLFWRFADTSIVRRRVIHTSRIEKCLLPAQLHQPGF